MIITVVIDYAIQAIATSFSISMPEKIMYYNNSPFIALGAVILLIWASQIKEIPAEKTVTVIGNLTFGVYLLHDNDLLRSKIWNMINAPRYIYNLIVELFYMFAIVALIFFIGCTVEMIRKKVVEKLQIEAILGKYADQMFTNIVQIIDKKIL